MLLFLSDGAPSDHCSRRCDHGISVWQSTGALLRFYQEVLLCLCWTSASAWLHPAQGSYDAPVLKQPSNRTVRLGEATERSMIAQPGSCLARVMVFFRQETPQSNAWPTPLPSQGARWTPPDLRWTPTSPRLGFCCTSAGHILDVG